MEDVRDRIRRGVSPKTYVLVAFLLGAIVWIRTLDVRARPGRPGRPTAPAAAAVPVAAAPRPGALEPGAADPVAPTGWGRDPFDPRDH
jgi:hypothetical protein